MIKYTAGYVKVNPNFVIQNIDEKKESNPSFSIVKNILTRGCPTVPSRYLREKFGEPTQLDDFKYYLCYENLDWDKTIKGGADSNPARDYYNDGFKSLLNTNPRYLGSFIPECSMDDIIYGFNSKDKSHVDFYSPIYKQVIEIDGGQHSKTEQVTLDQRRDRSLKDHGVGVIRVSTKDNSIQKTTITENKAYINCLEGNPDIIYENYEYIFAIRLELLLANLYANEAIPLNKKEIYLNLHTDISLGYDNARIIVDDFYNLLKNVLTLQDIDFKVPIVHLKYLSSDEELSGLRGINVDISLLNVYSDPKYDDVYYIRNDYFLYEEKKYFTNENSDTYWFKKNYYHISYGDIEYHLNAKKHGDALRWILQNTSQNYDDFRENQLDIIIELLNNRAVIGVLPTGAGKSLCYQLCAMLIPSMTLVIDPLLLLMNDQSQNIQKYFGITNIAVINSAKKAQQAIFEQQQALVTYISPERFFSMKFTDILKSISSGKEGVGFVVIDEVHCLSEWGHDFRTSYLCLSHNLREYLSSNTYLMALTGTASYRVLDDVINELKNFKGKAIRPIYASSMRRDNLNIKIIKTNSYYNELKTIIKPSLESSDNKKTLVFTKTKKGDRHNTSPEEDSACISLCDTLLKEYADYDIKNKLAYYAGGDELAEDEKTEVLNSFRTGKTQIVLATKAFGMGVDIPDIRTTIHYGLPSSLEGLYQEMGRAGRDGLPSDCYVLYKQESNASLNNFFARPLIPMEKMKHDNRYLREFQTNFFFITNQNLDLDIEEALISLINKMINEREEISQDVKIETKEFYSEIISNPIFNGIDFRSKPLEKTRNLVEKALYRLFLLGEIDMWAMVYDAEMQNPTYINLSHTGYDEDEKLQILKDFITKYQTDFVFEQPNTRANRTKYLINWANENYLTERVQTMKTLYDECESAKSGEDFMRFISEYFSNDPVYNKLVDSGSNYNIWLEVLMQSPEQTRDRIARLLESYDQVMGINYVSGVTRLRLGEFSDSDGETRLKSALFSIKTLLNEKERRDLFINTYYLIDEEEQRDQLIKIWISSFRDDIKYIYKETKNQVCEKHLIYGYVKDILELGGEFNAKL